MPLTSKISEYSPLWAEQFGEAARQLRPVFDSSLLAIEHVGSTSVKGLAAKPEIDVLIITAVQACSADWSAVLSTFGYKRGKDLSPGHQFYKRDVNGVRTHKLHICTVGHEQIERMLAFRDELRRNDRLRDEYGALKIYLERTNTSGISEYLEKKEPFINSAMKTICSIEN